jgi:DNA-binding response OmpR family regulator
MVTKPTGDKIMDVRVHYLRKRLVPFGIAITTLWGFGYQLSDPHRRMIMDLILARVAQPAL